MILWQSWPADQQSLIPTPDPCWEVVAQPGLHFPDSLASGWDQVTGPDKGHVKISYTCHFWAKVVKYQSPSFFSLPLSLLPVYWLDNSGVTSRLQNSGAIR